MHSLKWLVVVVLLSAPVYGDEVPPYADSLAVHVQLPKTSFLTGECMPANVYLVNQTSRTLCVYTYWTSAPHLRLECRDSQQRLVRPFARMARTLMGSEPTQLLLPNDSLRWSPNLAGEFGSPMPDGILLFSQPTGTYTIAAFLGDRLSSSICSYSVEEPEGADAAVLRQLKEIGSKYDIQRVVAVVDQLEALLNLNLNSIYSPQILMILQHTHNTIRTRNYAKVVEYGRRLIEEYPDSYEIEYAFDGLVQVMNREAWFAYLTQVESTKAGTRAARRAHALQRGVGPLPIDLGGGK